MPRQAVFRILSVFWISTVVPGISSIDDDLVRGRRFGGYRIVPKSCKDYTSPSKSNTGVCMFNYECTQSGGSVVGSCIHGFLFGACCKLLPGASLSTSNVPTFSPTSKPSPLPIISDKSSTVSYKPIVNYHPAAETILLHKNGSIVEDHIGPEEFGFFGKPQTTNFVPQKVSTSHNSFTDLNKISTDSSYNSSHNNQIIKVDTPSKSQISTTKYPSSPVTRKPSSETTSSFSNQSNSTFKHAGMPLQRSTTPSYPTSSSTKKYNTPSPSYYDSDNMVLVPTLTAGEKPQSEGQSNQESINHILSILNNSDHGSSEPEPMVASTKSPSQTLYTWVSVDGKTEKAPSTNNYFYSSTTIKPTNNYFYTTGSTSGGSINHTPSMGTSVTHHIPGPSFQVTPEIKITPKPPASSTLDPVPTVIVLSSLHTTQKPYQKPVYDHPSSTTVGYKKPPHTATYQSSSTHKIKPINNGNTKYPSSTSSVTKYPSSTSSVQILYTSTIKPTNKPITQTSTITISPKPNSSKPPPALQETVYVSVSSPKPQYNSPVTNPDYTNTVYNQQTVSQSTYNKPGYYPNPILFSTPQQNPIINSTEDLIAFPPVRDPNNNFTATQGEKPLITATTTFGDYGDEDATPQLAVDENLDSKVHVFVEKIVQSLQGNFEDLEKVLLSGENRPNITISNDPLPTKRPYNGPNTTKRPSPNKKPTKKPKPTKPLSSKPTTPNPYRPTPLYTTLASILPSKKPTTSAIFYTPTTTEGSYIITQPTKKPKPSKKPTVPSEVLVSSTTIGVSDDVTSTSQKPYDLSKECGVRPLARKNGRIVGGKGASFGEWPWQVLVKEATWLGLFTKNKCGGVLITNRYVITAAHCQPGFLANLVAVFGEYDISGELEAKRSISKNVRRVIVHRQYDAATFENDIALLELETPIAYDSHIVPICMPKDEDDFTGRIATVSGWGRLKYGGGVPSVLQEVQVPVIENNVCQEMFQTAGHAKTIINSFLCAGYANGQRDSCEGDSGGPLMVERGDGHWVLAGTVSHGIKCAAPYLPGVYMRTTYYKPWLQTITGVQ